MSTFRINRVGSERVRPRPRRRIGARYAWTLKLVGFRYSASRDAYVLRIIGNRSGPVYQVHEPQP